MQMRAIFGQLRLRGREIGFVLALAVALTIVFRVFVRVISSSQFKEEVQFIVATILTGKPPAPPQRMQTQIIWMQNHRWLLASTATLFILFCGGIAWFWKKQFQRSYGFTEVAFGSALSYNVLVRVHTIGLAESFVLVSAVYIIARGLNNISDSGRATVTRT
jgi:hypothetical protein